VGRAASIPLLRRCGAVALATGLTLVAADFPPVFGAMAQTGRITGSVHLESASSWRLATPGAYPTRRIGAVSTADTPEFQNVVVFLRDASGAAPPMRVTVRQSDEVFVPHVVAVTAGSTVEFPNDDLVFHNVFSLSKAATFDLGRYPKGASKTATFPRSGIVKVYCHLHAHMSALVRVFDHPFFAVVGREGRFAIDGVEPGVHEIAAWHERAGEEVMRVTVEAGATHDVTFSLPLGTR
jgi:plastocyanin